MYKEWFIWTKDCHHHEPFTSLFYMLFRMYDMFKELSCTSLYIAVHINELPLEHWTIHLELGELEFTSTKISFKIFEKSKSRPAEKMRL